MLRAERQSARISKITNDGLTRSGTGVFIVLPIKNCFVWLCIIHAQSDKTKGVKSDVGAYDDTVMNCDFFA